MNWRQRRIGKEEFISDEQQFKKSLRAFSGDKLLTWKGYGLQQAAGGNGEHDPRASGDGQIQAAAAVLDVPPAAGTSAQHMLTVLLLPSVGPLWALPWALPCSHCWPELHPPKPVLMNVDAKDQHSPGYNRAAIKLFLGNGACPALQHQ